MNVHEEQLIRTFITPSKRDRYLSLFATKKGRSKLVERLDHNDDFDTRYLHRIPSGDHTVSSLLALLRQRGAPSTCYVVSVNHQIDGQEIELQRALAETIGQGCGTFISSIPGKLGYFEAEDRGERYLVW